MKYILAIIGVTIAYIFTITIALLVGLWNFRFIMLKEELKSYKIAIARLLWNGFKINIY